MNNAHKWYSKLKKPSWAPPSWVFAPVWTVLYIIIAYSFGVVFYNAWEGTISFAVAAPFILNLIFNFSFTPIQFVLKDNGMASIDITLVFATLVWALAAIWPIAAPIAYMNAPYLLWVSFAMILQFTVTRLNKK